MEVILAKSAGYCFGVRRAVDTAYRQLGAGKRLACLGQIIHNQTLTADLAGKGVRVIQTPEEALTPAENGVEETVLIRSHGVSPDIYQRLAAKGAPYIDCTCPCVKRIHALAGESRAAGRRVIIVGDPKHPEVEGIVGYAGPGAIVLHTAEEARQAPLAQGALYALVVQTTFNRAKYEEIVGILQGRGLCVEMNDTICDAMSRMREEAVEIARQVGIMLVLGSRESSNSTKLFEICRQYCQRTYFIESIEEFVESEEFVELIEELELNNFSTNVKIGITAGASTPPAIIKEAMLMTMSDMDGTKNTQSFEEMLDESFVTLHTGDVVKGAVIQVSNGEVSVNLGYKSDGVIPRNEFSEDPSVNPEDEVKPGDEIQVYVVRVNDGDGNVLLSRKKLEAQKSFDILEGVYANKEAVPGKIVDVVKGGLIALINGVRVFVPSSQASNRYVEDLSSYKGKELSFNIIEFDRNKRRIVAGRKELAAREQEQKKEAVFGSLEVGQKVSGTVSRIVDFGAFVDLGGVDGLIHISELAWSRVKRVKDVLKEGDAVTATVLEINKEKGKISLTLKDILKDPWNTVEDKYPVGSIVEGKVVRMVPFGAFVELEDGVDGLIHISQIAGRHVVKPEEELTIGQIVQVKVTDIDLKNKKISLSKKEVDGVSEETEETGAAEEMSDEVLDEAAGELTDDLAEAADEGLGEQ